MLEHTHPPLAPRRVFVQRMQRSAILAVLVIGGSLAIGVVGYHVWGHLAWIDALANASMILGGMGPVDPITTVEGKLFESIYALYAGVALLTSVGVLFAPALHRFLHRFHLQDDEVASKGKKS
jgi:hypothetical protein